MSFHTKVLACWVIANLILVPLGMLNTQAPDPSTATDPDMVAYGMAKALGPIVTMIVTAIPVVLIYLVRGTLKLAAWLHRKVS